MNDTSETSGLVRASIYQHLRREVLNCTLRPGQQLQERELVERFRVSKSPIRDALLKLEQQGLVEVLPRKGYRVRRIDISDVRDMYRLRQILERECAILLIETATDEVLGGLDAFRQGPEGADLLEWTDYNRAFHSYIALNCGNARLSRISLDMIEESDRLTYVSVTSSADLSLAGFVREHGEIIDAIQARNKRRAAMLIRDHIDSSRKRVLGNLEAVSVIDSNPENR